LRSDSGYLTYIITTRRMTSGELLKYRNGLLMAQAYKSHGLRQAVCLTLLSDEANLSRSSFDNATKPSGYPASGAPASCRWRDNPVRPGRHRKRQGSALGALEFCRLLGSAGCVPGAVRMRPRARELAAINDEILVADRPPVEEALEDFPCSGGVSRLR
jgi:hypothetical protein